ncbi:MAG: hypothetical protein NZ739_02105 [Verrucomicrobiae bacterium]|nr:hypothetical protein [Verrucomicrobiae bacterium]MCX7722790.1 hypothetical protein [Verrucomicrobiae bacterium]MDW7980448.1 hypothetical protein [Verrucomicrobiales bacterium]
MKTNIGIGILAVLCGVLAVMLVVRGKQAQTQRRADADTISALSNELVKVNYDLSDQRQVNATLERALDEQKAQAARLTNEVSQLQAQLAKANEELLTAQAEIAKRDAKIAELETQNQSLDQHAAELATIITNLNAQIAEVRQKLAAAEGDRAFLEAELKRLLAEKAEFERKFNDIKTLSAQLRKLKEEMAVARRLEWARKGLLDDANRKGAEKLLLGIKEATRPPRPEPRFELNVEIDADGTIRIIKPLTGEQAVTNPPPRQ